MIAATVAGAPVPTAEVDAREAALRDSAQAAALPRPHTSEGRQLRRWLTQVLVTERVVAREADALGVVVTAA
ncbi:MAG: malonyl CoA-ACP transacylase, partial [Mycobacterium sp.]|nr:malonyl CoA-ACP transacylase [Mycobacterium sp.]